MIVNAGGVAAVIDFLGDSRGNVRLPGIMMLGYVAAHSENLAMAVIVSKVCYCKFIDCQISRYRFLCFFSVAAEELASSKGKLFT